jgi:hypothetical protein
VIAYITTHGDTLKWEVRVVFVALHQVLSVTIGMAAKMANIGTGGDKYGENWMLFSGQYG